MAHRDTPSKEPLQQHDFVARAWSKVGADLCDLQGRTLLVVSDYYSNFIEVKNISRLNTGGVSKALKTMFSRYGIPDELVTDNGPQFVSSEFAMFARYWGFKHVTSSPRYPQSNGKAENAVKTVKRLFTKCCEAGESEYRALLDWRNTPSEGLGTSPAQRFLGRRCKTLLPISESLLEPQYPTKEDTQALRGQKMRQQYYYNQHTKELPPIAPGEAVWMRLPGQTIWSPGVCTGLVCPRSYKVKVGDSVYRRNRRQLIRSHEEPVRDLSEAVLLPPTVSESPSQPANEPQLPVVEPDSTDNQRADSTQPQETSTDTEPTQPQVTQPLPLRTSQRSHKPPKWITRYVHS